MEFVLEACDPNKYVDAHGQLKWENVIVEEYNSLMKKKTWTWLLDHKARMW